MTIIIHQMGKVGSSAILTALRQKEINALQTHNLGKEHLISIINNFLLPVYPIERIKSELQLLNDQIIATKLIENARIQQTGEHQKIITLYRHAVDRWFSALVQNYSFYLENARALYQREFDNNSQQDDRKAFDFAISNVVKVIRNAPDVLGSKIFSEYFWKGKHIDSKMANTHLIQIGAELIVPFYWFQSNIEALLGINFYESPLIEELQVFSKDVFEVMTIKFEYLKQEPKKVEQKVGEFVGTQIELMQENVSKGKLGYEIIKSIKNYYYKELIQCNQIRDSIYMQYLGYD
jgi:hypothetical protein